MCSSKNRMPKPESRYASCDVSQPPQSVPSRTELPLFTAKSAVPHGGGGKDFWPGPARSEGLIHPPVSRHRRCECLGEARLGCHAAASATGRGGGNCYPPLDIGDLRPWKADGEGICANRRCHHRAPRCSQVLAGALSPHDLEELRTGVQILELRAPG